MNRTVHPSYIDIMATIACTVRLVDNMGLQETTRFSVLSSQFPLSPKPKPKLRLAEFLWTPGPGLPHEQPELFRQNV